MKSESYISRKLWAGLLTCAGFALMLGYPVTHAKADAWNKKTVMTIDQPVQVTDNYLEPGTYVFKLVDSSSDRHIVQIFNANEKHLIATIMAIPDYRTQVTGKPVFRMWETPAGYAPALRAWFYPGDNFGQEFPYPKNLRQIAVAQNTQPVITPQPAPAPAPEAQAEVTPQPEPQPEIAQNEPPPPPPAAEQPAPAPTPATETPKTLPQTASSYPLVGFIGALLIGAGGLIRRTRSA
jgi:LPXTG-motif cell wall-anchored protein